VIPTNYNQGLNPDNIILKWNKIMLEREFLNCGL